MAPGFPSAAYSPSAAMLAKMRPRAVTFSVVIQVVRVELNCPWTTENAANAKRRGRDFMAIAIDGMRIVKFGEICAPNSSAI
jgi:hypothetical protein